MLKHFFLSFLLLLAACGDDTPAPPGGSMDAGDVSVDMGAPDEGMDDDLGTPTGQVSGSPSSLTFRHVPGETPCPQTIGTLTLTNPGLESTEAGLTPENELAIQLSHRRIAVPAGGEAEVEVLFTCRVETIPILLMTSVVASFADGSEDFVVAIEGDVR